MRARREKTRMAEPAQTVPIRAYRQKAEISQDVMEKLSLSAKKAETLEFRELHCPFCGRFLTEVQADLHEGGIILKCNYCKETRFYDFALFHRRRPRRRTTEYSS